MTPITLLLALPLIFGSAIAAPLTLDSRADGCFVVGTVTLPKEVEDAANFLKPKITCDASKPTIGTAPDVTSGGISFSSINFAASNLTPLNFALKEFATATPLKDTDLAKFEKMADVYTATEVALRSTGANLAIKEPKFFLAFQIARIKTAQGVTITKTGQSVQHLLGKVLKNAAKEDQKTKDLAAALAIILA